MRTAEFWENDENSRFKVYLGAVEFGDFYKNWRLARKIPIPDSVLLVEAKRDLSPTNP